ncbi:outer membrane porin, OprD family [Pseudomonas gingeri]|uniref:OprD family outer membrane porin n=1 Tax=Pseudomonas gingeri TaxID=117681 RepID=UPI00159FF919|nr:OprD family outer membrane porin [Pseudomonas gingeri]NWA28668.1 outer membrane porin, OprD family [Pseudomonas gingeri]
MVSASKVLASVFFCLLFSPAVYAEASRLDPHDAESPPDDEVRQPDTIKKVSAYVANAHEAEEQGFFAGSHLNLFERLYFRRLFNAEPGLRYQDKDSQGQPFNYTKSSAQLATLGTTLSFTSGYTQGPLGMGVDASLMNGTTVYGNRSTTSLSADMANTDNEGEPNRNWSKLSVADVKFKISETELKLGRQVIDSPLLHSNYNRTFPASFYGATLASHEMEGFVLKAGSVTRVIGRNSTNEEPLSMSYAQSIRVDRASYAGAEFTGSGGFAATAHVNQLEDVATQYLLEAKKRLDFDGGIHVTPELAYYSSHAQGKALAGKDTVDMAIVGLTTEWGVHSVLVKYQQVLGDSLFDYLNETNSIYFSNTLYSDYQGPHEKSLQVMYTRNFADVGLPGLLLYSWAVAGWDIDGSDYKGGVYQGFMNGVTNGRHHEIGVSPTYVFQSGKLKDASIRVGYVVHRATGGQLTGDANELLLVGELPIKFF